MRRGAAALAARPRLRARRPRHLPAAALRRLRQRGEHNPFGMWQSLVNRATPTPSWLYHALERNARLRAVDAVATLVALPLVPAAAALELAAAAARRGGTVAVVARRHS